MFLLILFLHFASPWYSFLPNQILKLSISVFTWSYPIPIFAFLNFREFYWNHDFMVSVSFSRNIEQVERFLNCKVISFTGHPLTHYLPTVCCPVAGRERTPAHKHTFLDFKELAFHFLPGTPLSFL